MTNKSEVKDAIVKEAIELASLTSYAEIVCCVIYNRKFIRASCDKVFELKKQLDSFENLSENNTVEHHSV